MHGRVKVRTTEEEKVRKEKERKEKLKIFQRAMAVIQSKRKEGQLDKDLLEVIGQVLVNNPDIYTLWNIRRDILNMLRKIEETVEEITKLFDGELAMTEYCLKINPKSYCAWHQREWVLTTRTDPDWKKELSLCDKYLKLDERNFHTWDYRRFVVAHFKPPLTQEFDFTTEKLYENFSNYSAWHYRSKMLVELYPDLEAGRPIEDSHHKHELEMVQSAAFTDPDDTSAWFYQRWLLGAVKETTQMVVATVSPRRTSVAFNKSVPKDLVHSNFTIYINNEPVEAQWRSCLGNPYDNLWICTTQLDITDDLEVKVEFAFNPDEKKVLLCRKHAACMYVGRAPISFQNQYSEPVIGELVKQLDVCRQLLDLEPDNKWTLLTTTVFLHCIDARQHHRETVSKLKSLKDLDKLRAGYYDDLIAKWNVEDYLTAQCGNDLSLELKMSLDDKLTSLPHLQYFSFCQTVDLSGQSLSSRVLPSLVVLQHCKALNLANNNLTTLRGFPQLDLEELNVKGNAALDIEELGKFLQKTSYNVIY